MEIARKVLSTDKTLLPWYDAVSETITYVSHESWKYKNQLNDRDVNKKVSIIS